MRGWAVMSRLAVLFLMMGVCVVAVRADVKIKARQTMQGQTSEQTTYIKGKRQRTEMMNGAMISVQQCDLRRDLQISSATKTYMVNSYALTAGAQSPASNQARTPGTTTRGGLVTTTYTNKDTGERKQMFGYTARRIISTIVTESSPDACSPMKSRMETDGWYIDATFAADCDANRSYQNYNPAQASGCRDRFQTKQVGTARLGYPVLTKTTMFGEDGTPTFTMTSEVIEISPATLDAALFDVPAGYREVKNAAEMYGAPAATSDDEGEAEESSEPGLAVNAGGASSGHGSSSVGAKREGVIRLGVASVKTGAVGDGMNAPELAASVRHGLTAHLRGPGVEVVELEARLPVQIEAEAGAKDCDFVVYASVSHKKGGGSGFGRMLGGAASALGVVPVSGSAVAAHVASTASYTAETVSTNVKSKDELTLDLKLESPGGAAPTMARQFKAKARSNGEDIISPVVEQAAQAIMGAAAQLN